MLQAPIHVLVVDDDETSRSVVSTFLSALGHRVETRASGKEALERLGVPPPPDIVLLDVQMPEPDGIETLRRYRATGGRIPIVMISGLDEVETVVRAMRFGANDYATKPLDNDEFCQIIQRTVEKTPLRAGTSTGLIPGGRRRPTSVLGSSAAMRRVEALIDRVADADVPILITGESGVGKDIVAHELHIRSPRKDRVFVKINCAALPENLLESELFGYERGAFTGAQRAKPGQFELADGGTLFLDEIGEVPAPLQAKLLQALQDGEFYRVGGQKKVHVDVRIVVATNRDLERAIREGLFREDLYYRLNVVHLRIPPLRERREDIPHLFALFVEKYGRRYGRTQSDMPPEVIKRFLAYDWPGNVRELENLVRRLIVLRDPSYVYAEMRPKPLGTPDPQLALHDDAELPVPEAHVADSALLHSVSGDETEKGRGVPAELLPCSPPDPAPAAAYRSYAALPLANAVDEPAVPPPPRTGTYPFGGYASNAAATPLGDLVAADFKAAGEHGRVDLKALSKRAADIAEREAIIAMLALTGGSKREAAHRLRISYKAVLYKIREFGIGRPRTAHVSEIETAAGDDSEKAATDD